MGEWTVSRLVDGILGFSRGTDWIVHTYTGGLSLEQLTGCGQASSTRAVYQQKVQDSVNCSVHKD